MLASLSIPDSRLTTTNRGTASAAATTTAPTTTTASTMTHTTGDGDDQEKLYHCVSVACPVLRLASGVLGICLGES